MVGNVGRDLNKPSKAGATVGAYVLTYESGEEEVIPLVVGKNVADMRYGHFVPDAVPAFMMPDQFSADEEGPIGLSYHLDEMLPVEPKKQLMMYTHQLAHPGKPLKSFMFRATDPEAGLYLAAVTLRRSGPRMNALLLDGKPINPIPAGSPKVAPSILDTLRDKRKDLSLDGQWHYKLDPGNEGTKAKFFAADFDVSGWKTIAVPSQWYVQGIDYHGVVWFRRDVDVPADFPARRPNCVSTALTTMRESGSTANTSAATSARFPDSSSTPRPRCGRARKTRSWSAWTARSIRDSRLEDAAQRPSHGRYRHALQRRGLHGRDLSLRSAPRPRRRRY